MDDARSQQAAHCDAAAQNRNQQRGSHGQPALDERRVEGQPGHRASGINGGEAHGDEDRREPNAESDD